MVRGHHNLKEGTIAEMAEIGCVLLMLRAFIISHQVVKLSLVKLNGNIADPYSLTV